MMDKAEFTAAVLGAEETLYRVAKTMLAMSMTRRTPRSRRSCARGSGWGRLPTPLISKRG